MLPWDVVGIRTVPYSAPMRFPLYSHQTSIFCRGNSIELPWQFHGTSLGFPRDFDEDPAILPMEKTWGVDWEQPVFHGDVGGFKWVIPG